MNGKMIKNLPNLLTFCNMSIGLAVIYMMTQNPTPQLRQLACYLIFVGAAIDAVDGRLARRLHAVTDMGKQLDSFADLVTFGIAPLAVLFEGVQSATPTIFIVFLLFPIAGAFRLARYNLQDCDHCFIGLPITAAGSILAFICLMHSYCNQDVCSDGFLMFAASAVVLLSALMVSRFRMKRMFTGEKGDNICMDKANRA